MVALRYVIQTFCVNWISIVGGFELPKIELLPCHSNKALTLIKIAEKMSSFQTQGGERAIAPNEAIVTAPALRVILR